MPKTLQQKANKAKATLVRATKPEHIYAAHARIDAYEKSLEKENEQTT